MSSRERARTDPSGPSLPKRAYGTHVGCLHLPESCTGINTQASQQRITWGPGETQACCCPAVKVTTTFDSWQQDPSGPAVRETKGLARLLPLGRSLPSREPINILIPPREGWCWHHLRRRVDHQHLYVVGDAAPQSSRSTPSYRLE